MTRPPHETSPLSTIVEVLDGARSIEVGSSAVADDIVMHIDGRTFHGDSGWRIWTTFIRSRRRCRDLAIDVHGSAVEGDRVRLDAAWTAEVRGRPERSAVCSAWYRIEGDRVVEVWTTRHNYEFIVGRIIRPRAGWYLVLAYVFVWSRMHRVHEGTSE
jgi:hypothetical protein